jgi:hypothetical protein
MAAKLLPKEPDFAKLGAQAMRFRPLAPDARRRMASPRGWDSQIPARGLLVGLGLGIVFWAVLLLFARQFFR